MNPITEKLNALKTEYYENTGLYVDPTCYSADTSLGEIVSECISEESDAEISRTGKEHIELLSTLYFGGYYDMGINVVDTNRGQIYVMSYNDMINKLAKGKTVKLYPADYNDEYKQEIWNEFYNE
jgi:hypothetical protein